MSDTIDNGVEYALYWLAVNEPSVMQRAEEFVGKMEPNNSTAFRRGKRLLNKKIGFEEVGYLHNGQLQTSPRYTPSPGDVPVYRKIP